MLSSFRSGCLCGGSVDVGGALSSRWLTVNVWLALERSVWILVLLSWAINRDLNGDLASLDLFAVHVVARLLLELSASERHEAEPTSLAWLVAGLQLADHEFWNRAQGDLGGGWLVVGEDLEQLQSSLAQ